MWFACGLQVIVTNMRVCDMCVTNVCVCDMCVTNMCVWFVTNVNVIA